MCDTSCLYIAEFPSRYERQQTMYGRADAAPQLFFLRSSLSTMRTAPFAGESAAGKNTLDELQVTLTPAATTAVFTAFKACDRRGQTCTAMNVARDDLPHSSCSQHWACDIHSPSFKAERKESPPASFLHKNSCSHKCGSFSFVHLSPCTTP